MYAVASMCAARLVTAGEEARMDATQEAVECAWRKRDRFRGCGSPCSYYVAIMSNRIRSYGSAARNRRFVSGYLPGAALHVGETFNPTPELLAEAEAAAAVSEEMTPEEYVRWVGRMVANLMCILRDVDGARVFVERHLSSYLENFRRNGMTAAEVMEIASLFPPGSVEISVLEEHAASFRLGKPDDGRSEAIAGLIRSERIRLRCVLANGRVVPTASVDAWDAIVEAGGQMTEREVVARFGGGRESATRAIIHDGLVRIAADRGYALVREGLGRNKVVRIER